MQQPVHAARPRTKHPLKLTLLSENYKQLLQEFHDFQGVQRGSSSSNTSDENHDDENQACTPGQREFDPYKQPNASAQCFTSTPAVHRSADSAKSPRASCTADEQPACQHTTAGTITPPAASRKRSKSAGQSRRPACRTPSASPQHSKYQQKPPKPAAAPPVSSKQQQQHLLKDPSIAAAGPVTTVQAADGRKHVGPRQDTSQQQPVEQAPDPGVQLPTAAGVGPAGLPQAANGTASKHSCRQQAVGPSSQTPGGTVTSSSKPQISQPSTKGPASKKTARPGSCKHIAATAAGPSVGDVVATCTASEHRPAAAALLTAAGPVDMQPAQQQQQKDTCQGQQQQQQHQVQKRSRRRVGANSQPLTAANTPAPQAAPGAAAPPAAAATAKSTAVQAVSPPTTAAHSGRTAVELPRLALQHLQGQGPPGLLPPVYPTTARSAQHSGTAAKASKSEPASARMSRRTSDSSAEEGILSSGRRSDNNAPAAAATAGMAARQHSLPDPAAGFTNRRHSIACLVEASRKQLLQRPMGGSEGGLDPGHTDSPSHPRSQQQQQQQQPLQPLRQLQELRRRGQLRASTTAADDGSSHEYQILVLDGSSQIAAHSSIKPGNSSSSCTAAGPRLTATEPAAAGAPDRPWPAACDPLLGPGHRRTRSSNTQLPPLDEHAVLVQTGLPQLWPQAPTAAAAAQGPGRTNSLGAGASPDGLGVVVCGAEAGCSSALTSRRSSRADSEASSAAESTSGALVCEPSSFGVCADPAGAVHLMTPTIPDKLARLKQRLPSRLTGDSVALAVAAVPSGCSPDASARVRQSDGQGMLPAQLAEAADKPQRTRARWQPVSPQLPAVNPQLPAVSPQQQAAPPTQPQAESHHQQQWQVWQQQQQRHDQGHIPARSKSCKQPAHDAGAAASTWQQPLSWDGSAPMQLHHQQPAEQHCLQAAVSVAQPPPALPQQQQQQQASVNQSFLAEVRRQLEHWASWVHLHSSNPQQVPPPPQLPPEVQAAFRHQEQQQQQQQIMMMQNYPAGQLHAAAPFAPPGALSGFVGPVPAHGALSMFTDPWAEKQQQRLLQHHQQQSAPDDDHATSAHEQQQQLQQAVSMQQPQAPAQHGPVSPVVVSAAALLHQRRTMQQQAFEGLSLEAVLASAKKTAPSRRQLMEKGADTADDIE